MAVSKGKGSKAAAKAPKREKLKHGRPSGYSLELSKRICQQLALGKTLTSICAQPDMPDESTVRKWALDHDSEFYPHYARARHLGYLKMADDLVDIADDGRNDWMTIQRGDTEIEVVNREAVARSQLRTDTRKWLLSKALPKIYGDKLDVKATHEAGAGFRELLVAMGTMAGAQSSQ
jgi:hypothetical protein